MFALEFMMLGALIAFLAFQANMGLTIWENIYRAFVEEGSSNAGQSPTVEGVGHTLNYLIQATLAILGGGYGPGAVAKWQGGI